MVNTTCLLLKKRAEALFDQPNVFAGAETFAYAGGVAARKAVRIAVRISIRVMMVWVSVNVSW